MHTPQRITCLYDSQYQILSILSLRASFDDQMLNTLNNNAENAGDLTAQFFSPETVE